MRKLTPEEIRAIAQQFGVSEEKVLRCVLAFRPKPTRRTERVAAQSFSS